MPALPKKILSVLAVVALLAAAIGVSRFDAEAYGRRFVELAQEQAQLTLRPQGAAHLRIFPYPAVVLGRGMLSGRGESATFDELRLNLGWWPLLSGKAALPGMVVRGLDVAGLLHLDEVQVRFDGNAVDIEGNGTGLGLANLSVSLQSAPQGDTRNLALAVRGQRGAEQFDLRLVADRLQLAQDRYAAEKVTLVAQFVRDGDSLDAVLSLPKVAGGYRAAQADGAALAVTHAWNNARLTAKYHGAATLDLAAGWLAWPAARLAVELHEPGKAAVETNWHGATRYTAAAFVGEKR